MFVAGADAGLRAGLTLDRLSSAAISDDPVLSGLAGELANPGTQEELVALERAARYPDPVLRRLEAQGLARCFADEPDVAAAESRVTAHHLASVNALGAYYSGSLAITIGVNALGLLPTYLAATPEQRRWTFDRVLAGARASLLLTERDRGSNLLAGEMRAELQRPNGDAATHYRLEGEKHLINGGGEHALLTVLARTAPPSAPAGHAGFSVFVVPRDRSVRRVTRWATLPVRAADISTVCFEGTVVPESRRLGPEGHGFALVRKTLAVSRGGISALAAGAASRARELAAGYALRRAVYGGPIAELGGIREHLLRLAALDRLVACVSLKATAATNALGLGASHYAAVAKYAGCALAEEAVAEGRAIHGSAALLEVSAFEPLNRDVLLYGVFDGSSHLMLEELSWRLAQVSVASDPDESLDRLRELYAPPPRRLVDALARPGRVRLPAWPGEAAVLSDRAAATALWLPALTGALTALVRTLREAGRWDADQALRFEAGRWFAMLEALLATVELSDPYARAALDVRPAEEPAYERELHGFATGWFAGRIAAAIRTLSLRTGVALAGLARAEAEAAGQMESARSRLPAGTDLAEALLWRP